MNMGDRYYDAVSTNIHKLYMDSILHYLVCVIINLSSPFMMIPALSDDVLSPMLIYDLQ